MQAQSAQANRLFLASCVALITTAASFAIRGNLMLTFEKTFNLTNEQLGHVNSGAFYGFALSALLFGAIVDGIGMRKVLGLAFIGHLAGIALTIFATGFWSLFGATLLIGIANGSVEAACNPLVATLYPNEKTKMLNRFHVWFPGGIVIGGLVGYQMAQMDLPWQLQMVALLVPNLIYGYLFWGQSFPATERVASGVTGSQMVQACLAPLFIFMMLCMMVTAATELGTGQWISALLENSGFAGGILVLVFINGLMAVGRMFAGPVVHRLAPQGVLLVSAVLATAGLVALSMAGGAMLFGAAAIFAMGVCYFWPTMLGFVNENLPRTGALGLALMGAAGMFSTGVFNPVLGGWLDKNLAEQKANLASQGTVAADQLEQQANLLASQQTLLNVAILPAALIVAFLVLNLIMRNRKPQHINDNQAVAAH